MPVALRVTANELPRQRHWPYNRHRRWLRTKWKACGSELFSYLPLFGLVGAFLLINRLIDFKNTLFKRQIPWFSLVNQSFD